MKQTEEALADPTLSTKLNAHHKGGFLILLSYNTFMELQVGVKVLIRNDTGKYLFLKREQPLSDGTYSWDIPGGRIYSDEPILAGLKREVLEETGIDISNTTLQILNSQDIFITNNNLHVVRLTYVANCLNEAIILSDEHSEYRYLSLTQAMALITEPQLKETLELL